MSNNIRIRTNIGSDNYVKLKLEQDFDFIEVLSLKLSQEDAYKRFCSDYGVVVGRVVVNGGFGVPNAKVSVFIPIDDVDSEDVTIKGLYPYETVTDKDSENIRYNLLPKFVDNNDNCFTPVGTFPSKREILDNEIISKIYSKYYKFTTTTNYAGDFMIFGVPVGTHTIHVDADISDIGIISQKPYDLINQGTPTKFFESPTKFKYDTNLDKLPQIKTANVGVNVEPFWGDPENCVVGITRVDVDLNYTVSPSAIFIGSIFSDNKKSSVNKRCRPRKSVGELKEQITGEGTINMIRKTVDGTIEQFDVDGGNLIDQDGTWAYQIPMNLDYMVTDEFGNMVLSENQSIGIPTRASVRFKIGMFETGGEGRLRTRANFLVPNNPKQQSEIDYNFDEQTKDSSFKDIYWNKIYTVSNFIARYQRAGSTIKNRNIIAVKNVSNSEGNLPFPYNRLNPETSPLFFFACIIIKIISFIVYVLNYVYLSALNFLINAINIVIGGIIGFVTAITDAINWVLDLPIIGGNFQIPTIEWNDIPYIPCIQIPCSGGNEVEPAYYAPGCDKDSRAFEASQESSTPPNYYCGDDFGNVCTLSNYSVGVDKCIASLFLENEFDFYNDWINGTLYAFLIKYKKRIKGREIFCEYDCDDFRNDPNYSGVDGNNNNRPDNGCLVGKLVDVYVPTICDSDDDDCESASVESRILREGLIKKYKNELFYASSTHTADYKLYATDLICLGSITDCDWQGYPKLQPFLLSSTFKLPPMVQEIGEKNDGTEYTETAGMTSIDGNTCGLFFNITCTGTETNREQALNIQKICEFGVDFSEANDDNPDNIIPADCKIGPPEIDDTATEGFNRQFRNSFIWLNLNQNTQNTTPISSINSDFNIDNETYYNFTSASENGPEYINFRYGNTPSTFTNAYYSTFNSLYMYFGLFDGKTAIDKLNQRYFTYCEPKVKVNLKIKTNSTPAFTSYSGTITFSVSGGIPDYNYSLTGPNNYSNFGTLSNDNINQVFTGLEEGLYVITITDSAGNLSSTTVSVSGPVALYCLASVYQNATSETSLDGKIRIDVLGGGQTPYNFILKKQDNTFITSGTLTTSQIPYVITDLAYNITSPYVLTITDSLGNNCITTGLTINGLTTILVTPTLTNPTCYNSSDGKIILTGVTGGIPPYQYNTTGPNGFQNQNTILNNLRAGQYITTVTDSNAISVISTNVLTPQTAQITIGPAPLNLLEKQCIPNVYFVRFSVQQGITQNTEFYVQYKFSNSPNWVSVFFTDFESTNPNFYEDVNGLRYYKFAISPSNFGTSGGTIKIRISTTFDFICKSNEITYNKTSIGILPQEMLNFDLSQAIGNPSQIEITVNGGVYSGNRRYRLYRLDNYPNSSYQEFQPFQENNPNTIHKLTTNLISYQPYLIVDSVGCTLQFTTS